MNILIVGAGAVGLVYGQGMAAAGHRVTFFIKEKYRATLAGAVTLVRQRRLLPDRAQTFAGYDLLSDWQEVAKHRFDQVLLAIPSTAVRQLPFDTMKAALFDATLVMLQPAEPDYQLLLQHWPAGRIVKGMINLISYYHPMPGQKALPDAPPLCVAWYLPPAFMPMPLSCDDKAGERLATTLALFRQAGFPAKAVPDAVATSRLPNALLMTFLCALQASGWSFARLRRDRKRLALLSRAQKELLAVLQPGAEWRVPAPWFYRIGLWLAPGALPFSLETYLEEHFTKVGAQTDLYMRDFRVRCDSEALGELHELAFGQK